MARKLTTPYVFAGAPLIALGATFAAIGSSGSPAFGNTAVGLLMRGHWRFIEKHVKRLRWSKPRSWMFMTPRKNLQDKEARVNGQYASDTSDRHHQWQRWCW